MVADIRSNRRTHEAYISRLWTVKNDEFIGSQGEFVELCWEKNGYREMRKWFVCSTRPLANESGGLLDWSATCRRCMWTLVDNSVMYCWRRHLAAFVSWRAENGHWFIERKPWRTTLSCTVARRHLLAFVSCKPWRTTLSCTVARRHLSAFVSWRAENE